MKPISLFTILNDSKIDNTLKNIAEKVFGGERINFSEGILLFEKGELGFLGSLANYIKENKSGNSVFLIEIFILNQQIFVCLIANSVLILGCLNRKKVHGL